MIKPCIKRYGLLSRPQDVDGQMKTIKISDNTTLKEPFLIKQITHWAYIEIGKVQSFVLGDDALIYDLESAGFINLADSAESII